MSGIAVACDALGRCYRCGRGVTSGGCVVCDAVRTYVYPSFVPPYRIDLIPTRLHSAFVPVGGGDAGKGEG